VGVSPTLITCLAQGFVLKEERPDEAEKLRIHRRFWISLMLQHLIKEEPMSKVAESFGIERGFLQSLATTTGGFAGMVQTFCGKLGWGNLAMLLGGFKERLLFGVRTELLELAKLPYVKGFTARVFWEGGMKSVGMIAESDVDDILPLLLKVWPGVVVRGLRW
jgi:replicative superfamily II helicase